MNNNIENILKKFPNTIPLYVKKHSSSNLKDLVKYKYLVPSDMTVGQFIYVLRKNLKLKPEESLFIYINNTLPCTSTLLSHYYFEFKNENGFLLIEYCEESVFGEN
jgi:GABA(A) receptor-associated protein